jgi:hypothetical protein
MRGCRRRGPTGTWREFLTRHASNMWACDFFCVPTVLFQTLHVFFVIRLANREIFHVAVTRHPTADWAAQQIVECCAWDRAPPRCLIHDRDSRYGANFDRRVRGLGIRQVRTPFGSPRANAVARDGLRSVRSECLDHLIVFNEANLRRVLSAYVTCYNRWRPHRSLAPGSSMRRGKAPPLASMPKDRHGTCAWRVTPHLPHCCMTSFCAPQRSFSSPQLSGESDRVTLAHIEIVGLHTLHRGAPGVKARVMAWTSLSPAAGGRPSAHDRAGETTCPGNAFATTTVGPPRSSGALRLTFNRGRARSNLWTAARCSERIPCSSGSRRARL